MALSERSQILLKESMKKWKCPPANTMTKDYHFAALHSFADLPKWEKIARSKAFALSNQAVRIEPYDRIAGRVYHEEQVPPAQPDPDLDWMQRPMTRVLEEFDGYAEMADNQFFSPWAGVGHISWLWERILRHGISGMRDMYTKALQSARDSTAGEFYQGVLILLDAVSLWNRKHVDALEAMGMESLAAVCRKVPEYPAESFHEAVQAFFFQHICVMSENPHGGNSPGRVDYYLWPYLERDLQNGTCSLEDARILIDELYLRLDERIHNMDGWGETISLGGSHTNGTSAVNPLSYIMIESIMDLNITHPLVYPRLPENPPLDFFGLCVKYLKYGSNRAQILSDKAITNAMAKANIPYSDAVQYACGGCMEVSVQGMNCDYIFNGWSNIPKLVELAVTGGFCLKTGRQIKSCHFKGLASYTDFDHFYNDFEEEVKRIYRIFFKVQDIFSEEAQESRPCYLLSSMMDDCMARGRNMHGGGCRYHNYGSAPLGLPNAADAMYAIKRAVFDDKFCTAGELTEALKANYEGCEPLRLRLMALPKYGQKNKEADEMAKRIMTSVCDAYDQYTTRWGGKAAAVVLTFVFAPEAAKILGATADGNFAGRLVAHGLTPQSSSMTKGITAAIGSNLEMPMELFAGGASTMWDLDAGWADENMIGSILDAFLQGGGQIFQGNTTDVRELIKARENPDAYGHIIVRVGGYSARFTSLSSELQEDIIMRYRHAG